MGVANQATIATAESHSFLLLHLAKVIRNAHRRRNMNDILNSDQLSRRHLEAVPVISFDDLLPNPPASLPIFCNIIRNTLFGLSRPNGWEEIFASERGKQQLCGLASENFRSEAAPRTYTTEDHILVGISRYFICIIGLSHTRGVIYTKSSSLRFEARPQV